jgi:hypothetical protein
MDWTTLWPTIIKFLTGFTDANKTPDPTPTPTPNQGADAAVKALQAIINQVARAGYVTLDAPLVEDGWLGPKTDAAIMQVVTLGHSFLG